MSLTSFLCPLYPIRTPHIHHYSLKRTSWKANSFNNSSLTSLFASAVNLDSSSSSSIIASIRLFLSISISFLIANRVSLGEDRTRSGVTTTNSFFSPWISSLFNLAKSCNNNKKIHHFQHAFFKETVDGAWQWTLFRKMLSSIFTRLMQTLKKFNFNNYKFESRCFIYLVVTKMSLQGGLHISQLSFDFIRVQITVIIFFTMIHFFQCFFFVTALIPNLIFSLLHKIQA